MSAVADKLVLARVLGPVDVVTTSGVVAIGSRLERLLLAALAVSANQAVSASELADTLWGDAAPLSRDNTLQTYISRLRLALGTDRIATEGDSYTLVVAADELDATVFETLIARAASTRHDPEACLALCTRALSLWRGDPFGTFSSEDPFRLVAIRLDEIRLFACELRLECEIALGNESMVVGSLEALVAEYPYRERIWHLLVIALSLSGRRVEALRACTELREILAKVGLEPTAAIRQLEDEILAEKANVRGRLQAVLSGEMI
ncbi:MAG: AfsR/SARP family transcriptional regulator [bacterium]|nr:AfsR/SARP family transcriptional regulator [bacterium]